MFVEPPGILRARNEGSTGNGWGIARKLAYPGASPVSVPQTTKGRNEDIIAMLALAVLSFATVAYGQPSVDGYSDEGGQIQAVDSTGGGTPPSGTSTGTGTVTASDAGGSLPFTGLDVALLVAPAGSWWPRLGMRRLTRAPDLPPSSHGHPCGAARRHNLRTRPSGRVRTLAGPESNVRRPWVDTQAGDAGGVCIRLAIAGRFA